MFSANQARSAPAKFIDDRIDIDAVQCKEQVHRLVRNHRKAKNRALFSPFQPLRDILRTIHTAFIGNHQRNLYPGFVHSPPKLGGVPSRSEGGAARSASPIGRSRKICSKSRSLLIDIRE